MEPPTTPRTFFVAGVQHRPAWEFDAEHIGKAEDPTTLPVKLIGEPSNSFDRYAVKVMIDGRHVGYVPKSFSSGFWALHALGYHANASLLTFTPGAQLWKIYEVTVTFTK